MHRPNYNPWNNQQGFPHSSKHGQWHTNSGKEPYIPRRFNNYQFLQPYGDNLGIQAFNNEYWCETCDRGFTTQILLQNHKKQHQKCNIDGCQFIAHPKVITKHIQMQHSTGLYKKIAKLNNPEEIKKWREERRNKYPTKSNIDKKNLELKEKIERGETMGMKSVKNQDGHKRNIIFGNKHSKKENKLSKRTYPSQSKRQIVPSKVVKFETDQNARHLKPFTGIQQLIEDTTDSEPLSPATSKDLIEDDEFANDLSITLDIKPVVCGALVSLLNEYGSSDEEDLSNSKTIQSEEDCKMLKDVKEKPSIKCNENLIKDINLGTQDVDKHILAEPKTETMQLEKKEYLEEEDSGPEEVKVLKELTPILVNNTTQTKPQQKNKNKQDKVQLPEKLNKNNNFKRKVPSTLLEKLLSREIQQERNIVLQCVRYIIRNNYFEKDK